MNRRQLLLSFGALTVAGCASRPLAPTAGEPAGLEAVYAVTALPDGLTVRVASNGCTRKEDFAFYVERPKPGSGGLTPTLAFGRRRLDTCRSFAAGHVDLLFGWPELGLAPGADVVLLNPLAAAPGP